MATQNSTLSVATQEICPQLAPHQFRKGKSGNPGGRPKSSIFRRRSLRHLRTEIEAGKDQLDAVVDSQIKQAIKGDTSAFVALRDTIDGRPTQMENESGPSSIHIEVNVIGK